MLGADVFVGLEEEEQAKRHIADVEEPTDDDVSKVDLYYPSCIEHISYMRQLASKAEMTSSRFW